MFKAALQWFARDVLWPLLAYVLREVLMELINWAFEELRKLLASWRVEDEKAAASDAEREAVRARYSRRADDLDRIAREAPEQVAQIIERAMENWETERDRIMNGDPALPS